MAMLVSLVSAGFLAGCTSANADQADLRPPAHSAAPTATPTPTPIPSLDPSRSAEENLAYFDVTVKRVLAQDPTSSGTAVIDALVAAGFSRSDMEVTPDRTAADLEADSVQFAVRFNGKCLIGQRGPGANGYHSMVAPLLGSDRCLLAPTAK